MSATVKNAIMKGLVEGAIVELMVKTGEDKRCKRFSS